MIEYEVVVQAIAPGETRCDRCVRYAIWVLFGTRLAFSCDPHYKETEDSL